MVEKITSISSFSGPHRQYPEKISSLFKDNNKNSRFNSHLYQSVEEEIKNNIQSTIEKIKIERKKTAILKKENQDLFSEKMILLNKASQMIQGYSEPVNNPFPSESELKTQINAFLDIDLFGFFKEPLSYEFVLEGIVLFYKKLFELNYKKIKSYFEKMNKMIILTLQMPKIAGPLDWILRKSLQYNWEKVLVAIENKESYYTTVQSIQNELRIETKDGTAENQIMNICKKTLEILFKCYIMHPKIFYDIDSIGQKVLFNQRDHVPFEDKIEPKTESAIIIPGFYLFKEDKKEVIAKPRVLPGNY